MTKEDKLTRAQLRNLREIEAIESNKQTKRAEKEFSKRSDEINTFYRKKKKKQEKKIIQKSRTSEKEKMDRRGKQLSVAIFLVLLLNIALWALIIWG